jgi:hypothetical protein
VDDGLVIRDPKEAPAGGLLAITVARGDIAARVEPGAGQAGKKP